MSIFYENIPGTALYPEPEERCRAIERATKILSNSLGRPLMQRLLKSKRLVVDYGIVFQLSDRPNASAGSAVVVRCALYDPASSRVLADATLAEHPGFVAQVFSSLVKQICYQNEHFCVELQKQVQETIDFPDEMSGLPDRMYRSIVLHTELTDRSDPTEPLEVLWLDKSEGNKGWRPAHWKGTRKKRNADTLLSYAFDAVRRFADADLPPAPEYSAPQCIPMHLSRAVNPTQAKLPSLEELFGGRLDPLAPGEWLYPITRESDETLEFYDPDNLWVTGFDGSTVDWSDLQKKDCREIFAQPGGYALFCATSLFAPTETSCVSLIQTRVLCTDPFEPSCCELSRLPYVAPRGHYERLRIVSAYVTRTLDWAILDVEEQGVVGAVSALCTSWCLQASKLKTHTDYDAALAFWATAVEVPASDAPGRALADACRHTPTQSMPRYTLCGVLRRVLTKQTAAGASMLSLEIEMRRAATQNTVQVVLPASCLHGIELVAGRRYVFKGIFVISGLHKPADGRMCSGDPKLAIEQDEPVAAYRRRLRHYLRENRLSDQAVRDTIAVMLGENNRGLPKGLRGLSKRYIVLQGAMAGSPLCIDRVLSTQADLIGLPVADDLDEDSCELFESFATDKLIPEIARRVRDGDAAVIDYVTCTRNVLQDALSRDLLYDFIHLLAYDGLGDQCARMRQMLAVFSQHGKPVDELDFDEAARVRMHFVQALLLEPEGNAALMLARLVHQGIGGPADPAIAARILAEAVENGNPFTHWLSGLLTMQGRFFEADGPERVQHFAQFVPTGSPAALSDLASCIIEALALKQIPKPEDADYFRALTKIFYYLEHKYACREYLAPLYERLAELAPMGYEPADENDDFDPWAFLQTEPPREHERLAQSMRPVISNALAHPIFLSLWGVQPGPQNPLGTRRRFVSQMRFMEENALPVSDFSDEQSIRLLRYGAKENGAECLIAQHRAGDPETDAGITDGIYPVFDDACDVGAKLVSGFWPMLSAVAVISAAVPVAFTSRLLYYYDTRWPETYKQARTAQNARVSLFGVGILDPVSPTAAGAARPNVLKCVTPSCAHYQARGKVVAIVPEYAETAGVCFAKVTVRLQLLAESEAEAIDLPVYMPSEAAERLTLSATAVGEIELNGTTELLSLANVMH